MFVARLPQSIGINYQKLWMWVSYIFVALEINKLYINVCIKYRHVYMLYIQYAYTLQVFMSISVTVVHYVGWGCQSSKPRKYTVLNWNFVFNLCNIFQAHNPGVKKTCL